MIYCGTDKDERNQIIEEDCQELGLASSYGEDVYTLTEMMGTPFWK